MFGANPMCDQPPREIHCPAPFAIAFPLSAPPERFLAGHMQTPRGRGGNNTYVQTRHNPFSKRNCMPTSARVVQAFSARWTFVGIKFGSLTPILCAMRGSRFAPTCALLATAAATAVAVLTSRSGDWDKPGGVRARRGNGAHRRPLRHPLAHRDDRRRDASGFGLGMVALGPVPMLLIGQAVIFANRPSTRGRLGRKLRLLRDLPHRRGAPRAGGA